MQTPTRLRPRPLRPNWAALALSAALSAGAVMPAHAFWGLLGKAAGKAATVGKTAGTAGKGAAVGAGAVAAESATGVVGKGAAALTDDAAHAAQLGPRTVGAAPEFSAVNAALPPEVAAYLGKPAKDLTPKDTSRMMDSYRQMVERAGKSGDFTAVERLPTSAGTGRTLPVSDTAKPATAANPKAATETASPSANKPGMLTIDALRVLAHASHAGNREAQAELARVCRDGSVASKRFPKEMRATPEFKEACATRTVAAR